MVVLLASLWCLGARAQSIPSFAQSDRIVSGVLPGRITYSISVTESCKGYAEIALVQRGAADIDASRAALEKVEHVLPYDFLSRHNIRPGRRGFVSYRGDARIFRFGDVRVADGAALDSLLLLVTDICRLSSHEQTIIVSGDVDKAKIVRTLEVLSLTIPALDKELFGQCDEEQFSFKAPEEAIACNFHLSRLPKDKMSTPVPLVSRMLALELSQIIAHRVDQAFRAEGIACTYRISPESFVMFADTAKTQEARQLFNSILSDIRAGGVFPEEIEIAKRAALPRILANTIQDGSEPSFFVDKCIDAYLDGNNLASYSTINSFFTRRKVSPEREVSMLTDFACGILPDVSAEPRKLVLESVPLDSLLRHDSQTKKLKLRREAKEPLTGGKLWTFSNGMKVIYKETDLGGRFHYALMVRGGTSSLPSLSMGQAAYFSDLFSLHGVGEANSSEWKWALAAEDMTMKGEVSLSSLTISGDAPKASLSRALGAIDAFCANHVPDLEAYEHFRECEAVRYLHRGPREAYERMDSLLCPEFTHSSRKEVSALTPELPIEAEKYFDSRLSSTSDGVLLILGKFDEKVLLKALCLGLKDMPVSSAVFGRRQMDYTQRSGHIRTSTKSPVSGYDISLTAETSVAARSQMALMMASLAIADHLTDSLAAIGAYMSIRPEVSIAPKERMRVYMSFRPIPQDGLPACVQTPQSPADYGKVFHALTALGDVKVSDADMVSYRQRVMARMDIEMKDPVNLTKYVVLRYADGKDLCSDYAKHISQLKAADVEALVKTLAAGTMVSNRIGNE